MTSLFYEMETNPFMFQTTNQPIPLSKTSKDSEVMWFSTFFTITGSHVFALEKTRDIPSMDKIRFFSAEIAILLRRSQKFDG
jgi:hypothetical protein